MPCQDEGQYAHHAEQELKELREKVDKLTRMLCGLCTELEQRPAVGTLLLAMDSELAVWWEAHGRADYLRKTKEAALAKLTAAEREVLGL